MQGEKCKVVCMANKRNEISKFESNVQDVLNLKADYITLSYEEKINSEIHEALLDSGVLGILNCTGYSIETGLFYCHEVYLSKDKGKSKWHKPINAKSPKKGFSYYMAPTIYFDNFGAYYDYVFGNIYGTNDCYYQYQFNEKEIKKYNIEVQRLNFGERYDLNKLSTIIDILEKSQELNDAIRRIDEEEKNENEGAHLLAKAILKSKTWDEFKNKLKDVDENYCIKHNIKIADLFLDKDLQDQIFEYIRKDKDNEILKILLIGLFSPEINGSIRSNLRTIVKCNMGDDFFQKYLEYIKDNIDDLNNSMIKTTFYNIEPTSFYDVDRYKKQTLVYIERIENHKTRTVYSNTILTDLDEDKFTDTLETKIRGVTVEITKEVHRDLETYSYKNQNLCPMKFEIGLEFFYHDQMILRRNCSYDHLSEYLYVLDGDLSNMDLSEFQGLENVHDFSNINLDGSVLRSGVKKKLGLEINDEYYKENVNFDRIDFSKNNELATLEEKNIPAPIENDYDDYKIYYISDIHLEHRFENHGDIEKNEIDNTIQHIANNVAFTPRNKKYDNIVIVNGDICHNQNIYKDFLRALKGGKNYNTKYIIFTLGNHEYWECAGQSVNDIVAQYRKLIKSCSSYNTSFRLLQNSILYINYNDIMHEITEDQLIQYDDEKLQKELNKARLIFFGGTGFAGCNDKYNANCGLYRNTLNRKQEIEESKKFNDLYEKVCRCALDKKVIVITHNPKIDWSGNEEYHNNFIYLSGHTHRNTYYVSDEYSVYADNQIGYYGYKTSYPKTRYLDFDTSVDIFEFYKDGIYKISEEQYERFLHCKNIIADGYIHGWGNIYMLKREGYYCFIFETEERKKLSILNGNVRKALKGNDIQYYYDNMLNVIHQIDAPLFKYTNLQRDISNEVKRFGGDGKIHGCIIDIDYYNHIYLNPFDLTMIPYNAPNIRERDVYKSVPLLLEDKNPYMYAKYIASKKENQYSLIVPSKDTKSNKKYQHDEGTYPYRASRMMSKLQRINKNVLTEWVTPIENEEDGSIKQIGIDECTNDELRQIVVKENKKL